jgi:hypothetical protein
VHVHAHRHSPTTNKHVCILCIVLIFGVTFVTPTARAETTPFALILGILAVTCVDRWELTRCQRISDRTRVPTCESWGRTRAHTAARGVDRPRPSTPRASSAVCTHVHRWIMTSSSFLPAHPQPQHGLNTRHARDTVRFRFSPRRGARERVKPGL